MASRNKFCDCGRPATQRLMGQGVCQRCYNARDIVGGPLNVLVGVKPVKINQPRQKKS